MTYESLMAEWTEEVKEKGEYIAQLEDENAKLRELCAYMLVYVAYPYVCSRPDLLVERARELGIEVRP